MNTTARLTLLLSPALAALLTACAASTHPGDSAPSPAVTSAATHINPAVTPVGPGAINYPPPARPEPPIQRAPVQRPNPNFNAVAFETEGSPPGIRAQYEAAARAYREAAAQSSSPEREQYLEAARQLDRQAAELLTR
jgi:hypothetical protein